MRFRPCIDIHNGSVKQIVGGSLTDAANNTPAENYVSDAGAAFYAGMYRDLSLKGGHIIMLNKKGTDEYEASKAEALRALNKYKGGMQVGGGIDAHNAAEFIKEGASHVIVTSYIFNGASLDIDRLKALNDAVGKDKVVIDLSCRFRDNEYFVVTDRWQTFTDLKITPDVFDKLSDYCDEFLIHGVDVEGLRQGIDVRLLKILADSGNHVITYAGGVRSYEDIDTIYDVGRGRIDFTVGSALKIFGGSLDIKEIINKVKQ